MMFFIPYYYYYYDDGKDGLTTFLFYFTHGEQFLKLLLE
jgi:hypothetical protein